MVGMGHMGSESALARVSLVNYHGHVLLDTFVQPREKVTDWRTWVSGVRESDIIDAPSFEEVQKQVATLVKERILIGHAVENDMKVGFIA
jgi:RNA exonuclease 4